MKPNKKCGLGNKIKVFELAKHGLALLPYPLRVL